MWTKTFRRIETIAAVWSLLGRCCAWGVYSQSVSWGLANVTLKHQASLSSCVAVHNNDGRHALIVCWARASHLCLFEGEKILQQVRGWRRQTWGEILMWTGCLGRKLGGRLRRRAGIKWKIRFVFQPLFRETLCLPTLDFPKLHKYVH